MAKAAQQPISDVIFDLSGGRLCLDFANTVSGSRATTPRDRLQRYADLLSWSRQVGIASEERALQLLADSERHPRQAAAVLEDAKRLREAIFRIYVASLRKEPIAREDLDLLNRQVAKALSRQRLVQSKEGWRLGWEGEDAMDSVLWPVAKSAAELLTSGEANRVKQCEANSFGTCDWLFIDETRNFSKRWCSMKDCGNRAKARRHYHRQKKGHQKKGA